MLYFFDVDSQSSREGLVNISLIHDDIGGWPWYWFIDGMNRGWDFVGDGIKDSSILTTTACSNYFVVA